jgi:diguanylate cyclase (GGDEF)-like protein
MRAAFVKHERGVWLLFGLALLAWAGGELYYDYLLPTTNPPFPSWSDASYLLFYPLACAATWRLVLSRIPGLLGSNGWLNALIGVLTGATVTAIFILDPLVSTLSGSPSVIATTLAYPLGDMALLIMLLGVFALAGWRLERTLIVIAAALLFYWAGDAIFLIQTAAGTHQGNGLVLIVTWPVGALLIAGAAWLRPGTLVLTERAHKSQLIAPMLCALAMTVLLLYSTFYTVDTLGRCLAAVTLICIFLRMWQVYTASQGLANKMTDISLTDELTGLGNRRHLLRDLQEHITNLQADAAAAGNSIFIIYDLNGFKGYNDTFGHPAGDELLHGLAQKLANAVAGRGRAYRLGGDEFCVLLGSDENLDELITTTTAALSGEGRSFAISASYGLVVMPEEGKTVSEVMRFADQRMYSQKSGGRGVAGQEMQDTLLNTLGERDRDLGAHNREVGHLAEATARKLGMTPERVEEVSRAAELHDIGKVAIPDDILFKPGPLSDEEWVTMKLHTVIGERILTAAPALAPIGRLVRSSHEKWDGTGYPDGLVGEDIPMGARIVSVADAYEAMTADRVYRKGLGEAAARQELLDCAGTQFDPAVVDAFLLALEETKTHPSSVVPEDYDPAQAGGHFGNGHDVAVAVAEHKPVKATGHFVADAPVAAPVDS